MEAKNLLENSLKNLGIYSLEDYQNYIMYWRTTNGQKNTNRIRDIVTQYYYQMVKETRKIEGQFISINSKEVFFDESLDNYMCFFPKRTLVETDTLMTFQHEITKETYNKPPDHFFEMYFGLEKLMNRGIVHLYPVNSQKNPKSYHDSNQIVRKANVAEIYVPNDIKTVQHKKDMFYMAFPWLYSARTDDFIEICDKNPAAFNYFANSISKIAKACTGVTSDLNDDVFTDVKDALIEIENEFEKRKEYLKRKGITTMVGMVLTFVPFIVNKFFDNFNPELFSSFLGGTTIYGSSELLSEFWNNDFTDNPYWVVWKWKHETKNNK